MNEDFEFCNRVFCAIADVTGDRFDAEKEPPDCRVVTLVWHTSGLVGNGGFGYLFEGDLNGDPQFELTEAAYRSIGAKQAYDAFRDAMSLFPDGVPPEDVNERMRIYESHPETERDAIEARFFEAEDEVIKCLAAYIRRNRDAIDDFLRHGPRTR